MECELLDMFPDGEHLISSYAHRGASLNEIVDIMLEGNKPLSPQSPAKKPPEYIFARGLQQHAMNFLIYHQHYQELHNLTVLKHSIRMLAVWRKKPDN